MRTENDSMGAMEVPDHALYGASTQRAVLNFPISGHRMPGGFIRSCGLLKLAAAAANRELGRLDADKAEAIEKTAREIHEGKHAGHFPVDVFQTGSATSTHTNVNEVIANDMRWLGSGPRCGLGELRLPATQPGSSIMPGKVNPVMSDMLVQACLYASGQCQTVAACGREGQFELNVTIPLIAFSLHQAIHVLSNGAETFARRCMDGLQANEAAIENHVRKSLMLVTALNPHIGYDKAAQVAKKAYAEGRSLREVVLEEKLMTAQAVDRALDPKSML